MTDKEKINNLYLAIKNIEIPDFENPTAIAIGSLVKDAIKIVLQGIKDNAKILNNEL